jgi:hypothetical protein
MRRVPPVIVLVCACFHPVDERVPTTLETFCDDFTVEYLCGFDHVCLGAPLNITCDDLANVAGHHYTSLCDQSVLDGIDGGRILFHEDAVPGCLSATQTQCQDNCLPQVFEGTVSSGGQCFTELDCTSGLFCNLFGTCPGTCTPKLSDGADVQMGGVCASGASVDLVDAGSRCLARGARGNACAPHGDEAGAEPCAPGLFCVDGACGAPRELGQPCTVHDQWTECDGPLFCEDGGCVAAAREGESCRGRFCAAWLDCNPQTQQCNALGQKGTPCSFDCASPFACVDGVCTQLGQLGDACSTSLDCEGPYWCQQSQCTDAPQPGACHG